MIARKNTRTQTISSPDIFLQEADWANFNAKFLIGCANVHRGDVNNRQTGCFRCFVVDDCLAPCTGVRLQKRNRRMMLVT